MAAIEGEFGMPGLKLVSGGPACAIVMTIIDKFLPAYVASKAR